MSEENKDLGGKAEEASSSQNQDNSKTITIVAHLTFLGWIIALIMNNSNKTEIGSFYIRQCLGIFLIIIVLSFIPFVNLIGWLIGLVLWIISLIGAINGNQKPVLLVGEYFQNWFKSL